MSERALVYAGLSGWCTIGVMALVTGHYSDAIFLFATVGVMAVLADRVFRALPRP